MDYLNSLNSQQYQAVTAGTGQVLVLAGPGSGKTRVLTQRVAYLIDAMGVRPSAILAVTFTNKAAREMEERVNKLLPGRAGGLWLGTFHGVCARILRREAADAGLSRSFVIFDSDDQLAIVKAILRDLGIDKLKDPRLSAYAVHAAISRAKNDLILPEDYPIGLRSRKYDEVYAKVYQRYQAELDRNQAVDFDDLLMRTYLLLSGKPSIREQYARRFEHVLVDEFQDTNRPQYELVRLLSSYHHNLFVVGDEDQSIYRWRGADYHNILRFTKDYPDHQKILLEQNYRSTQTVLDAAMAVIRRNPNRTAKRLFTQLGRGTRLTLYEAEDDRQEAEFVVDTIRETARGKISPGDFAVMYRTNAQSRLLEEAFLSAGMPYRLVGAQRFYGRREVKDLIAYLRLIQNPGDTVSLLRVINTPPRKIGDKTVGMLQFTSADLETSPGEILLSLGRSGPASPHWGRFDSRAATALADFGAQLAAWIDLRDSEAVPALFDRILSDIRYQEFIDDGTDEGEDRWENVQELRRLAYQQEQGTLAGFLEQIALVSDQDTLTESGDAPTLLTLHAAKGLEFPQVIIVGLDEGVLPHIRAIESGDAEEMAEERRLFYVGITRAKERLYLVRADRRGGFRGYEEQIASSFLDDLPEDLVERRGPASSRASSRAYRAYRRDSQWDGGGSNWGRAREPYTVPPPARPAAAQERQFTPGMRVSHASWGEGMVIESRLMDGDEIVDVVFESVGIKRVMASLAKLQKL